MKFFQSLVLSLLIAFSAASFAGQININTADATTLMKQMAGVGKTRAEAIVAYREKNGPFANIDDLAKVDGIGQRTIETNREKLTVK